MLPGGAISWFQFKEKYHHRDSEQEQEKKNGEKRESPLQRFLLPHRGLRSDVVPAVRSLAQELRMPWGLPKKPSPVQS